jgi:nucleoside-diphosphate-sugar epimerase
MKILIVGGTGNISWRLTEASCAAGWQVSVLNRGAPDRLRRPAPVDCRLLTADMRDATSVAAALGVESYDAVIDFVCYNDAQARQAVAAFAGRTKQYIFISTTAFYDRVRAAPPFAESAPVITEGWDYALAKAQAERVFTEAARGGFPVTVIRPAHTYDTIIPDSVGDSDWTNPWRLLNGKPIIVHGDGTSLWTLTHSRDLAGGIMAFLAAGHAPGETFHITSDAFFTWREIIAVLARELGVTEPQIRYRTTAEIDTAMPRYGNGLKGHKMWCDIYDNRKFKAACPSWRAGTALEQGMREAVAYFRDNPQLMVPNQQLNDQLDGLCAMRAN